MNKRLMKKSSNENFDRSYSLAQRMVEDFPLVPIGDLVFNLAQDINMGLYDECGDPELNWDKWMIKTKQILKSRNII